VLQLQFSEPMPPHAFGAALLSIKNFEELADGDVTHLTVRLPDDKRLGDTFLFISVMERCSDSQITDNYTSQCTTWCTCTWWSGDLRRSASIYSQELDSLKRCQLTCHTCILSTSLSRRHVDHPAFDLSPHMDTQH
jgi:hypothetical protein